MVKRPGTRCSRRSEGTEHEKHVWREESEGAKRVDGPDQLVATASLDRDGAAVASSLKPRCERIGASIAVCEKKEDWSLRSDGGGGVCCGGGVVVKSVSRSARAADLVIMRR